MNYPHNMRMSLRHFLPALVVSAVAIAALTVVAGPAAATTSGPLTSDRLPSGVTLKVSAPVITSAPPANGTVGVAQPTLTVTASGDPAPEFRITDGVLPPGLSFDERTHDLFGTPTTAGSFTFTVSAANIAGTDRRTYTMVITPSSASFPRITSPAPGGGTVGLRYPAHTVTATGTPQPEFSISSGALPPGLFFDERLHELYGVPTTAGTYGFTITADNRVAKDSKEYTVVIAPRVGPTPTPIPTPTVAPTPTPAASPTATPTSAPSAAPTPGPDASAVPAPAGGPGSAATGDTGRLASTGTGATGSLTLLGAGGSLVALGVVAGVSTASRRRRA